MKKLYISAAILLLFLFSAHQKTTAQGIYQFWGLTSRGGENDEGALISTKYDATNIKRRQAFKISTPGSNPGNQGLTAWNGRLFGMMPGAGLDGAGIIYEYNPGTNSYTSKIDFFMNNMREPVRSLVLLNNKLYGITSGGGNHQMGVLFEYDPASNFLVKKYHFENTMTGIAVLNGIIYGTTNYGGANGVGYIFTFDPATNTYKKMGDLETSVGGIVGTLQPYSGRLYGVSSTGGKSGKGCVIEIIPNTLIQWYNNSHLADLGAGEPEHNFTFFNGKFYGSTAKGGVEDKGVLFEYDPVAHAVTKKMDFTTIKGYNPTSAFTVYNNKLYGTTSNGGDNNGGVLFEYDAATNNYVTKAYFSGAMGTDPLSPMVVLNDRLYGFTSSGGYANNGILFEYNPNSNGYIKKIELGINNGKTPYGKLTYYQGKLYGTTYAGGNNNRGVIFSYDLATHTYAIRHHMSDETGYMGQQGGLLLYNNKLYGAAHYYKDNSGCIFEFDPATDQYTVKYVFDGTGGRAPDCLPVVYNNKFYGTTWRGGSSDNGTIYEYNPFTNTCTFKVSFGGSFGEWPRAELTIYKNKLFGTTSTGGNNNDGTLFEYDPAINGIIVRHHFGPGSGSRPSVALTVHNDKLYGTTDWDNFDEETHDYGHLFEYDPATTIFTPRHEFSLPSGSWPRNRLLSHGNKLYGMTGGGGPVNYGGTTYRYDPVINKVTHQDQFLGLNGRFPEVSELIAVPALVAKGVPGNCVFAGSATINAANSHEWMPFTDDEGNAIFEFNANGNILGNVTVYFYTHNGPTRKDDQGRLYLDRNISVQVDNQPATPVSIRLYIRKTEFESLKNTPGSGILNISDLTVFKNDDPCSPAIDNNALGIKSTAAIWGLDYVYSAEVSSFSSFYFASNTYSALPVKLEYFNGKTEPAVNLLQWKASCTNNTDFIVERSTDGIHFSQVGMVLASAADCGHPFQFPDHYVDEGKTWYRLQMKEDNGDISYSSIIMLQRGQHGMFDVQLRPNPVTGSTALFSVHSPMSKAMPVFIYDAMGRLVIRTQWQILKGGQTKTIDVHALPPGVYSVTLNIDGAVKTIRFVRK